MLISGLPDPSYKWLKGPVRRHGSLYSWSGKAQREAGFTEQRQLPSLGGGRITAEYPAPPTSTAPEPYVTSPPAGYPMSKEESQKLVAFETKSKGDGFRKGC
ncbi:Detected protein of unknown function [Hibiscus syriacus]|uniref:Uncharacterized protein n=1 Tax=Hibiscus syriacus TaxID=106335 RepID=A0A6A2Z8N1_HIBSY|nr:Detected protein of unknown function [Hibiscus syriacus]